MKRKGECIFIYIGKKMKYYTKETLKIAKIMIIACFLITAIVFLKYKPVYAVKLKGQEMGYVENKIKFENKIETDILNKQEENIAYVTVEEMPDYEIRFIQRTQETQEDTILAKLQEDAKSMYVMYAVTLENEIKATVNTRQEAKEVVEEIKQEFQEDELAIAIEQKYTENPEEIETTNVQQAKEVLDTKINEKKEEEERTVNGIFLAVQPISGNITSRYGSISSLRSGAHTGLDIAAPKGTGIKAVASGTVTFAGRNGAYGNIIKISHGNGIETWYAHCSKLYETVGTKVEAGEIIAAVGSTGNSTGNHLHLEIRIDGVAVNPQKYFYK